MLLSLLQESIIYVWRAILKKINLSWVLRTRCLATSQKYVRPRFKYLKNVRTKFKYNPPALLYINKSCQVFQNHYNFDWFMYKVFDCQNFLGQSSHQVSTDELAGVAGKSSCKKLGSSYFNKIHRILCVFLKYQLRSFSHELCPATPVNQR